MIAESKLRDLGIELPVVPAPKAMYIPAKRTGDLLFVSGQLPIVEGKLVYTGKLGDARTLEEGQDAARLCAINILSAARAALGDLDKVANVVKIQVFANSVVGFDAKHLVANGA